MQKIGHKSIKNNEKWVKIGLKVWNHRKLGKIKTGQKRKKLIQTHEKTEKSLKIG